MQYLEKYLEHNIFGNFEQKNYQKMQIKNQLLYDSISNVDQTELKTLKIKNG